MSKAKKYALILLFLAGLLLCYQYSQTGVWFDFSKVDTQTLALLMVAMAIAIFYGYKQWGKGAKWGLSKE